VRPPARWADPETRRLPNVTPEAALPIARGTDRWLTRRAAAARKQREQIVSRTSTPRSSTETNLIGSNHAEPASAESTERETAIAHL
jgi:hypothetical protein